jgi:hypothetical protein
VKGFCDNGNELSGSVECSEILELAASQEGLSSMKLVTLHNISCTKM